MKIRNFACLCTAAATLTLCAACNEDMDQQFDRRQVDPLEREPVDGSEAVPGSHPDIGDENVGQAEATAGHDPPPAGARVD